MYEASLHAIYPINVSCLQPVFLLLNTILLLSEEVFFPGSLMAYCPIFKNVISNQGNSIKFSTVANCSTIFHTRKETVYADVLKVQSYRVEVTCFMALQGEFKLAVHVEYQFQH